MSRNSPPPRNLLLVLALVPFLLAAGHSSILPGAELPRRVLALYDSTEKDVGAPDTCWIHALLEQVLNHLGLIAEYHDAAQPPLPSPAGYRGIVVWFNDDRLPRPAAFLNWIADAARAGVPVVAMDGFGAAQDDEGRPVNPNARRAALAALGLAYDAEAPYTDNPFALRLRDPQPDRFGFETTRPPTALAFERYLALRDDVAVWRAVERTDIETAPAVGVAVSPRGGFVSRDELIVRQASEPLYRIQWDLDPFAFLEAALDCAALPRPDVTTAFGLRAAFSHIDSDGIANRCLDVPAHTYSGEAVMDEILKRYPVPVTLGLIAAWCDPAARIVGFGVTGDDETEGEAAGWRGQELAEGKEDAIAKTGNAMRALARRMYALPTIQPGCHGYAHPLNWKKKLVGLRIPGYRYSHAIETTGAMEIIRKHSLPPETRVELYQWTGDCRPGEAPLALLDEAGVPNINGGDPRQDDLYDGIYFLCPLTRPVGRRRQIFAAACNENLYTGLWRENFGGFRNVIQTFERTETPRRLLPVNVYYHLYSGERQASLDALRTVYDWCMAQPLCWIHAAEYCRAVEGFFTTRFTRAKDRTYVVRDYGACRTVRLDTTEAHVDMKTSRNILGYTRHAGALYIALAPGDGARFALTDTAPDTPYLRASTGRLRKVRGGEKRWTAAVRLYAPGFVDLAGWPAGKTLRGSVGGRDWTGKVDAAGQVRIPLPAGTGDWAEVRVGL